MSTPCRANIAVLAVAGAMLLAGCAATPMSLTSEGGVVTSSIDGGPARATALAAPEGSGASSAAGAKTADSRGAGRLALARSLRDKGDRAKALIELERGRAEAPGNRELAGEAGLVALELGQADKARKLLEAAIDPARPDWRSVSALGTALAAAGKQTQAQAQLKRALELNPNHRPTLNNLALSYALDGKLADAEKTLRAAGSGEPESPRQMKENLALVIALSGKYAEAERLATKVLPKDKAKANVVYVRSLTQQGS